MLLPRKQTPISVIFTQIRTQRSCTRYHYPCMTQLYGATCRHEHLVPFFPLPSVNWCSRNCTRCRSRAILGTQHLFTSRFVWPGMNCDVRQWALECISCQRAKIQRHTITPLFTFTTPDARFDQGFVHTLSDHNHHHKASGTSSRASIGSHAGREQFPSRTLRPKPSLTLLCRFGFHVSEFRLSSRPMRTPV